MTPVEMTPDERAEFIRDLTRRLPTIRLGYDVPSTQQFARAFDVLLAYIGELENAVTVLAGQHDADLDAIAALEARVAELAGAKT
jgi:hypothetical protein